MKMLAYISDYLKLEGLKRSYNFNPDRDFRILSISSDSRSDLVDKAFIALRGERFDGHDFLEHAVNKGARLLIIDEAAEKELNLESASGIPSYLENICILVFSDTVYALTIIAREYRRTWGGRIVTVTGSVGKTSTRNVIAKSLASSYLVRRTQKNLNNPIGVSQTLMNMDDEAELAVIELGMDRMGEIFQSARACEANVAVITNIGFSHIENLGSRENIAKAKFEIAECLSPNSALILNADDDILFQHFLNFNAEYLLRKNINKICLCGLCDDNRLEQVRIKAGELVKEYIEVKNNCDELVAGDVDDFSLSYYTRKTLEHEDKLVLLIKKFIFNDKTLNSKVANAENIQFSIPHMAEHHLQNLLISFSVARLFDIDDIELERSFQERDNEGNRERLERLGEISIFHDYYNASLESMRASFDSARLLCPIEENRVVILACVNELGSYAEQIHYEIGKSLFRKFKTKKDRIFLLGAFASSMARAYLDEENLSKNSEDNECANNLCADIDGNTFLHERVFADKDKLWKALEKRFFEAVEDSDKGIESVNLDNHSFFFLIKGSRGYQLETIADKIKEKLEI